MQDIAKQAPLLAGVDFRCQDYETLDVPEGSVVYCDPPYKGTTKYQTSRFDHERFYGWCRRISGSCIVFVSEYEMPPDFNPVWERDVVVNLDGKSAKAAREKLFTIGKN